jgi:hypothetical protein
MSDITKQEGAEVAADLVQEALNLLHEQHGIPMHVILAGAHAAVVTMLVAEVGGKMTAGSCERAAERVRDLPSYREAPLIFTPSQGSA